MRLFKDEQGIALIVAMTVLAIILILGVAIFASSQSALNLTVFDRASNTAFHAAEAGFNQAVYKARNNQLEQGVTTVTLDNVEYRVDVTKKDVGNYEVISTGASPNFSNPKAKRAISANILAIDAWNFFYNMSVGGTVVGNVSIDGPFYVSDLFSLNGTGFGAKFTTGPLYIKDNPSTNNYTGDLQITGNAQVGEASAPISLYIEGRFLPNTEPGKNLFYSQKYTQVPAVDFPKITIDVLRSEYQPKADYVWNGDLYFDDSLGGKDPPIYPVPVLSNPAFNFYWRDKQKTEGLIVFNGEKTVYVTDDLRFGDNKGSGTTIYFLGEGTFIAEDFVSFSGPVVPSAGGSTEATLFSPDYDSFPSTNSIGVITPETVELKSPGVADSNRIYAVLYAREEIEYEKQFQFYGTSITREMEFKNNPKLHYVEGIAQNLPPGMPQRKMTVSIVSWKEVIPN